MRARRKLSLGIMAAVVLAAVWGVIWFVRSERLQAHAKIYVIRQLNQSTGLVCSLDRLSINLFRGSFAAKGLVLASPPGAAAPVHIAVEEINGVLRLISILKFKVILSELRVQRPKIDLMAGEGRLSWNPEDFLNGFRKSLSLEAGSVRIADGEVTYNDKSIPFDLNLSGLLCEVRYSQGPPAYKVRLAYQDGRIELGGNVFSYNVDVRSTVSLDGVDIDRIDLRCNGSRISGAGTMKNWRSPLFAFHTTGTIAVQDLSIFTSQLADARCDLNVDADLLWDAAGFHSTAKFSAQRASYHNVDISGFSGLMVLENGVLHLKDVAGRIDSGPFRAAASFHLRPSDPKPHQFQIAVQSVSMRDVGRILEMPGIAYANRVDGNARLFWRQGKSDMYLSSEIVLDNPPPPGPGSELRCELKGSVAFGLHRGIWALSSADLHSDRSSVQAIASGNAGFHVDLHSSQIGEIFGLLRNFSDSLDRSLRKYPDLNDISGEIEMSGDVMMGPDGTAYQGAVRIKNGRWRNYALDTLSTRAYWDGNELDLQSLELSKGDANAKGSFHLALSPDDSQWPDLQFQGDVRRLPLSSLKEAGIAGEMNAQGIFSGSGSFSLSGGEWACEGKVNVEKGSYRGQEFDSLGGRVRLMRGVLNIEDTFLVSGPAKLNLRGQVRMDDPSMDLEIGVTDLSIRSFPFVQSNKLDVDGRISASGRIQGSFDHPSLEGSLELDGFRYSDWDLGRGRGTLLWKDDVVKGEANVRSDLGSFRLQAVVAATGAYPGSVILELKDWNARKLVSANLPPYLKDLSTAIEGKVEIKGDLASPESLTYRGEMDGARIKFHDYELSNAGKIKFTAANRKLHIDQDDATIVGDGTRLVLRGDIPLGQEPGLDLKLDGTLNLKMLAQVEKKVQVSGSAGLSVRAIGALKNPQVIGQADLKVSRLDYGELPFRMTGVQGNIVFSRNLVRLENIQGSISSGSFHITGAFEQQDGELRGINLQIAARKARLLYPKDFRSVIDADLTLRGGPDSQVLAGEIAVLRSDYMREFNLLEQIASRSTSAPGPLTSDPFLVGLRLNVGIRSDEGLFVDNELTRLRGGMRLTLRGTPAYPSLTGRVEATEGSIFFRGNRFDIVRASADFVDRNRINPVLNVRAEADVRSYRMLLDVNGDMDHMRFNVTSDPPLSTVEILSLLTTGKEKDPADVNSRRQAEITGLSAASILSESLTGALGKRMQRIFGLQSFRVDPFLAGAENDPTARVTINERVSKDLSITFSRNLSTNEEQIVIVEYDVNKNLSIVGTRNENGEYGIDFRFRKRFR